MNNLNVLDMIQGNRLNTFKGNAARNEHLEFMRYMWVGSDPFLVGLHTKVICERIDQAITDFENGQSTFLSIKVPFRHGKSQIVSRYLPANFIGRFPDKEAIVSAYSFELVRTFSRFSRSIMREDKYQHVYPNVQLSKESQSLEEWGVVGPDSTTDGHVYWAGIGGSVTGKGGALIVVDDFFKNRKEAESQLIRDNVWDSITNDILTRRAPVCIVIILATPWHIDDPFGRITNKMKEDPNFPKFEELKFPAFDSRYEKGVLFPLRFSVKWYEAEKAILGNYGTASLLQCDPILKSGNLLSVQKIKIIDEERIPAGIIFARGWDLASSEVQKTKDDPDYTVGIKLGVNWIESGIEGEPIPQLYISDMIRGRWEALRRNNTIKSTAIADGKITVGLESYGPYKDAYTIVSALLAGLRIVKKIQLPGDKVAKASDLEVIFESGNVFLVRGDWNQTFINEISDFPGGSHDDIVDALVSAFACHSPNLRMVFPEFDDTYVKNFGIDFKELSPGSELLISLWTEKNLKTSIILALWNRDRGKLYIFGEIETPTTQPQQILVKIVNFLRFFSNNKKRTVRDFQWFGNAIMFTKNAANLQSVYRKYSVYVRENQNFDEFGSIAILSRLMSFKRLLINNKCSECRALCSLVSGIHESGISKPREVTLKPFGKKSQVFQQRVKDAQDRGRMDEFIVNPKDDVGSGKDSWMV